MEGIVKAIENQKIEIKTKEETFHLPLKLYEKYSLVVGAEIGGDVQYDKIRQRFYFEPNHPIYKIGDVLDFDIQSINNIEGKNIITVLDVFGNEINILGLRWQKKEIFTKSLLKCEIIGFRQGKPILRNVDFDHPIYKIGEIYDFQFIGIETKTLSSGDKMDVIRLKGEDDCIHETPLLAGQGGHKFKPSSIRCKITSIIHHLKLEQIDFKDYYFSKIEEILQLKGEYINKYFFSLKQTDANPNIPILFRQYESGSSLWTITYCKKVLPELIMGFLSNFNIKEALITIEILLTLEKWILRSGFLDSFKKESTKSIIKHKSERYLEKFTLMKRAIEMIDCATFEVDKEVEMNVNIDLLGYFIRFNRIELIDFENLIKSIDKLLKGSKVSNLDSYNVNSLVFRIEVLKYHLKQVETESDFTIMRFDLNPFSTDSDLANYLKFTLIQVYLLHLISEKYKRNQYISVFLKYLFLLFKEESEKRKYLKYAFYYSNNLELEAPIDSSILNSIHDIKYVADVFISAVNIPLFSAVSHEWKQIVEAKKLGKNIHVNLTRKDKYGLTGTFAGVNCILSKSNYASNRIRNLPETETDIVVAGNVVEVYNNFNTILIKELHTSHPDNFYENKLINELKVGDIIVAKVKSIQSYGVFLYSIHGEGLLHKSDISYLRIDVPLLELFEPDQELTVYVKEKTEDHKIFYGLKQLAGTEHESRLKEIELKILAPELYTIDSTEKSIQATSSDTKYRIFNQGQIFEYFSTLQHDFEGKIKYLKLAKVFYSGIKSARSYFLNIYIAYYNLLQEIEICIDSKSEVEVERIVNHATEIYDSLLKNTLSIEKYPSIHRLIYFVEILSQFNRFNYESYKTLSKYIFEEEFKDHANLKKVAKVVLANNLIISEKKDLVYIIKNLRIAFQYLKDGVFDVADSEIEKRERELKEKISNIRNKIIQEESETLELKSSLIKPILDPLRSKRLKELQSNKENNCQSEIENLIGAPAKKKVIHSAMKTLVAFANSKGGTLYIGINDNGDFIGLDNDFDEIGDRSKDSLGQKLDEYIKTYIGNSFFGLISITFESIESKDILIINVKKSDKEVFLIKDDKGTNCSDFYIRRHSSSVKIEGKDLIEYFKHRFK